MEIRQATTADIDAVEATYTELLTYEAAHGTASNWVLGLYPVRRTAELAVGEGTMFVLTEGGKLCASMILNEKQGKEYRLIPWRYVHDAKEIMVLHTLCIPPSQQRRGYGKKMVLYALEYAAAHGYKAVRIDTWFYNTAAAALYTACGFRFAGTASTKLEGVIDEEEKFFECKITG